MARSSSASLRRIFFIASRLGLARALLPAGPVAAYVEGEEIEAVAYTADSGLLPVEGQAPFLQPYAELSLDRLRLLATLAQCHEIVRVDYNGRAAWLQRGRPGYT